MSFILQFMVVDWICILSYLVSTYSRVSKIINKLIIGEKNTHLKESCAINEIRQSNKLKII